MQAIFLVGAGGAIGAVARYGTGILFGRLGITGFPWATMTANITGSFAMGLLIGWLALFAGEEQAGLRLFLAVGLLGGFTTFSSFSLDAITLFERGQWGPAAAYVLVSVAVSLVGLMAGLWIMRSFAS